MVVDGDLIPGSGKELIRQNARIPILIGITHKEWSRKERKHFFFSKITVHYCLKTNRNRLATKIYIFISIVLLFSRKIINFFNLYNCDKNFRLVIDESVLL